MRRSARSSGLAALAALLLCATAAAQSFGTPPRDPVYSLLASSCVSPGEPLEMTATENGFGRRPNGVLRLRGPGAALRLTPESWSAGRVLARAPSALPPGARYALRWARPGATEIEIGSLRTCGAPSGGGRADPPRRDPAGDVATPRPPPPGLGRPPARRDEVAGPDGAPEFIVSAPTALAAAAQAALIAQGATVLRTRSLPVLGRELIIVSLPPGLSLAAAQTALNAAANGAVIDVHHRYGFTKGPRIYASHLIGDAASAACALRKPVRVGLIDGPVNPGHPAFAHVALTRKSMLLRGQRAVDADHGTAVAALIGGAATAGPLRGFASGAALFAAEAFSRDRGIEGASAESVGAGIDWLLSNNVRLINLSFAGRQNRALEDWIGLAAERGVALIAAAGNDGAARKAYPAGLAPVIAVTAVDAAKRLYPRANTGAHIDFAAPGVEVYAAKAKGGGYVSGTSYAAPIVTALAARLMAAGRVGPAAIRRALEDDAEDLGAPGRDPSFGWGLAKAKGC